MQGSTDNLIITEIKALLSDVFPDEDLSWEPEENVVKPVLDLAHVLARYLHHCKSKVATAPADVVTCVTPWCFAVLWRLFPRNSLFQQFSQVLYLDVDDLQDALFEHIQLGRNLADAETAKDSRRAYWAAREDISERFLQRFNAKFPVGFIPQSPAERKEFDLWLMKSVSMSVTDRKSDREGGVPVCVLCHQWFGKNLSRRLSHIISMAWLERLIRWGELTSQIHPHRAGVDNKDNNKFSKEDMKMPLCCAECEEKMRDCETAAGNSGLFDQVEDLIRDEGVNKDIGFPSQRTLFRLLVVNIVRIIPLSLRDGDSAAYIIF